MHMILQLLLLRQLYNRICSHALHNLNHYFNTMGEFSLSINKYSALQGLYNTIEFPVLNGKLRSVSCCWPLLQWRTGTFRQLTLWPLLSHASRAACPGQWTHLSSLGLECITEMLSGAGNDSLPLTTLWISDATWSCPKSDQTSQQILLGRQQHLLCNTPPGWLVGAALGQ